MDTMIAMLALMGRDPVAALYLTLAATYACATSACRCHVHTPWQLYALSAAVYGAFAMLHVATGH